MQQHVTTPERNTSNLPFNINTNTNTRQHSVINIDRLEQTTNALGFGSYDVIQSLNDSKAQDDHPETQLNQQGVASEGSKSAIAISRNRRDQFRGIVQAAL